MNEQNLLSLEEMREHEWDVPWSGGKDSTATILLMLAFGIPIRSINHVRMMWDEEIPATLPVMYQFVDECVERFRKMGLTVNVVKSKKTAVDLCTKVYTRSKCEEKNGKMYGITAFWREMCKFSSVKTETGKAQRQKEGYFMLGYAADETKRLLRLNDHNQSILATLGVNENECYDICRKEGMLSPHYEGDGVLRDGCWFCPNATEHERKCPRENFPELVEKIEWMIGLTDFKVDGLIVLNKWLTEYAKAHPDDWRWKDSKYAHPKNWIPGQIEMEKTYD